MASLSLPNRDHQRNPKSVMQAAFNWVCHECEAPMKDLGYWHGGLGQRIPLFRCVSKDCAQCAVSHAPVDTTFASRNWI